MENAEKAVTSVGEEEWGIDTQDGPAARPIFLLKTGANLQKAPM